MLTLKTFQSDPRGRTFPDVSKSDCIPFDAAIAFFREPARVRRMMDSELHHNRPALAGAILEFEELPEISAYFNRHEPRDTIRFRQAVGIMIRIVMLAHGWEKTGIKGSLGTRGPAKSASGGKNSGGLSNWFSRTERYCPGSGTDEHEVWKRRNIKGERIRRPE